MADKSLKATIQLDMDASGVARGVAATNKELSKLNRSASRTASFTGLTAAMQGAQIVFGVLSSAIQAVNQHVEQLTAAAFKFSPEAMQAKMALDAAKIATDVRIGQAIGPGAAAGAREQQLRLEERAAAVEANAPAMAGAVAGFESLKATFGAIGTAIADQFMINLTDPSSNRTMTQAAFEAAGLPQMLSGEGFSLGGSTRGMPYDPAQMERQTRALESIDRKMGGN